MPFLYFFLGVTYLQIIFTGVYYLLLRRKEYLYYTLFSACLTFLVMVSGWPSFFQFLKDHLSAGLLLTFRPLVPLGLLFYYRFMGYYTDAPVKFPRLKRHFKMAESLMAFSALLLWLVRWIFSNEAEQHVFSGFMYLIVPINLFLIFSVLLLRQRLTNIVSIGSFLMFLFVRFSLYAKINISHPWFNELDDSIVLLIGGIMLDFLFFDIALIYKTQLVYSENIRLAVEKQEELGLQRLSISNDLHDEIGSSLSSIQLELALAAHSKVNDTTFHKNLHLKISEEVKLVLDNMNDIIWAVKKGGEEEKSFSNRIKDYYYDLMDARQISSSYEIDRELEKSIVSSSCRKNLLLLTKEAINNVLKHSEANSVVIRLYKKEECLYLEIHDNGIGFTPDRLGAGNGLESMRTRSEQMSGTFTVNCYTGKGTLVQSKIPLSSL